MTGGAAATGDDLRRRNLDLFRERFPELHARVAAITQPVSRIIEEDGVAVDIDLGCGRLYKEDGRALSLRQAEDFIETPRRVGYQVSNAMSGDSPVSQRMFLRILNSVREHGAEVLTGAPVGRAGFLFVFGLGLGHHLDPLVRSLEVDWVVVVETIDEFVLHSLSTVDWTALAEYCDAHDTKLSLFCEETPALMNERVSEVISEQGELGIDGSFYYRHYPSWPLNRMFEDVVNNVPMRMIQRGYYEDERKMLWNAVSNLQKYDCRMLSGAFQFPILVPAFLVTSGPSVDYDIEYIRKWRDHAIIFSGGSSLQVLLAHGIIPDYHVELENVVQVWDFLQHILALNADKFPDGRFTGIKLIASVTLNPRVTPLFDETYYFFRDSVSSSICFADQIPLMSAIGPNVANTIMAVAARIGFRHVYMFGMDCGWRDGESHHSKDTAYYTSKEFKTAKVEGDYTFPGNFGGTIQSTMILGWTRDMLEAKVNTFRLRAYNCSDGALIKGAVPKLSETIEFTGPPLDREAVFKRVREDATWMERGSYLSRFDFDAFIAEIDTYEAMINDICDQALLEADEFRWMLRRLTEIHHNLGGSDYVRAYSVLQGPSFGMAKSGCVFLNRIEDPVKRRKVFEDFVAEYRAIHQDMAQETREIFSAARDWIKGGSEPAWAAGLPTMPGYTF
ncbi:motility associated factor glycosyltransferase family protein [Magnetospirillum sp. SS-4]|uniref:motility associated factor glycosyltransferase family protein n=1 Tax=Magnetospirillum sp. SS-4 TaxID=2681465 RepID=UPI0013863C03|nr:6-hydroxymethylpterin diphosphokinase MptE-like protein [Magnetospirillum sp. SS-4]CAA7612725.1 conserved hypothetical protein [Magnetospirillum sp. SS-4]